MTNHTNHDESDKFVQANRGPLGNIYESIRSAIHDSSSDS